MLAVLVLVIGGLMAWIFVSTNFDATSGRGWELLAAAPRYAPPAFLETPATRVSLIPGEDDLGFFWAEMSSAERPDVDLARQVVVWAVAIGSGSCPTHLDSVDIGEEVVISASAGFHVACTADAVPYTFVIAIDRQALPSVPFRIRVVTGDAEGSLRVDELPG